MLRSRFGGIAAAATLCALVACGGDDDDMGSPDARRPDAAVPDAAVPDADTSPDAGPDDPPPAPVTGLTAVAGTAAGAVDLTWTHPADDDLAGVIVVRRLITAVAAAPVDGTTYGAGDTLGAGDVVVYAGTGTSFTDAAPPGFVHYAAFAVDDATQWSTAARDDLLVGSVAQTATITVAMAPLAATVTQQPAHHVLAATATYDGDTDTLTVHVDATNGFARNAYAVKGVVSSVNQGAITGDGALDGDPYVRLAPSLGPAATGGADLVFTGVDGTVDPVLIELAIADHPIGVVFPRYTSEVAYELLDTGTASSAGTVPCDELRYVDPSDTSSGYCGHRAGAMSADGTRLFTGYRSLPLIREVDLATQTVVRTLALDAGIGGVRSVAMSPDGATLYALLTLRGHAYWGSMNDQNTPVDEGHAVVRIDAATLTETGRLVLYPNAETSILRLTDVTVSANGARLAIPEMDANLVHLVDTATMTAVDTDAATDGVQPLDVSAVATDSIKQALFDAAGATLYVQTRQSDQLLSVSTATWEVTSIALAGAPGRTGALLRTADGRIYVSYSGSDGLTSLTLIDGVTTTTGITTGRASAVARLGGALFVVSANGDVEVVDATTLVLDPARSGAVLAQQPAHDVLLTPY